MTAMNAQNLSPKTPVTHHYISSTIYTRMHCAKHTETTEQTILRMREQPDVSGINKMTRDRGDFV